MKKNAFYAQSGGVTSVINSTAAALILEAKKYKSKIGKVYAGKTCYAVGQGVLSRLVVFANKLFANIAGKSVQNKTDLVVIDSGMGDIESFRSSWREGNF